MGKRTAETDAKYPPCIRCALQANASPLEHLTRKR